MSNDVFCVDASREIGEPLAGTAAGDVDHWLVLEHDGPWGPKGVDDSGLPSSVVTYLGELGRAFPRLRVQLIRRHDAQPGAGIRLFLARSGEQLGRLGELSLQSPDELPSLGLERWLSEPHPDTHADPRMTVSGPRASPERWPEQVRELTRPLYLVCVHGKRDRCCAMRGMPLYTALRTQASGRVWQTTHLGGHRFAATMVVLPHGICYGRLADTDAPGLFAAHEQGELYDLAKLRGRTSYPPTVQAAEVLLRQALADKQLASLRWLDTVRVDDAQESPARGPVLERVRFRDAAGGEHSIELERVSLPPAPASCGAAPKPVQALVPLRARGV
jgi:hypothetical protein